MDVSSLSAISALAGSGIGAMSAVVTTWLTQHSQTRSQRHAQGMARRERLYQDFIEEASKLFVHSLSHELADLSAMVEIYAMVGKLRLFASSEIVSEADKVMELIVETYYLPNADFSKRENLRKQDLDVLQAFSAACRNDLRE